MADIRANETSWRPGQSGNPEGTISAGRSWIQHVNDLARKPVGALLEVQKDKSMPALRRSAARVLIRAAGNAKDADRCLGRVLDYTDGKPIQRQYTATLDMRPPLEQGRAILAELRAILQVGAGSAGAHDVKMIEAQPATDPTSERDATPDDAST